MIELYNDDCLNVLKNMEENCVDLVVTSPPYDNLRTYNNSSIWNFEIFQKIAEQLVRVLKDGGVIVWIVGDATIKGSETCTSFKQALYFKELGLNLHDTMIWEKSGMIPTQDRYYSIFEYMFIFSKGKPKTLNFIEDKVNVNGGRKQKKDKCINKGHNKKSDEYFIRKSVGRRTNIWRIPIGSNKDTNKHPAPFPIQLAKDHIISWSNKGDTVLDPFLGSGTCGVACINTQRNFIGIEINKEYFKLAETRIDKAKENIFEL